MKALTIRQPWAWAIIHDQKNVENRNWAPKITPGRIAIHAAKAWGGDDALTAVEELAETELPGGFMLGVLLGTVDVIDIHMPNPLQGRWAPCVVHGCETWGQDVLAHWVLSNPSPLTNPIPCKGALGLWTVPADIAADLS